MLALFCRQIAAAMYAGIFPIQCAVCSLSALMAIAGHREAQQKIGFSCMLTLANTLMDNAWLSVAFELAP